MRVSIFITIITALHNINFKKEIKTMIVTIAFIDKEDLVQFEARVLEDSGNSSAPCPFDSEILDKVKSLTEFREATYATTSSGEGFCCIFMVPRSSFKNVDSIRELFAGVGYTEIKVGGVTRNKECVEHDDAKVFEFALVPTKNPTKEEEAKVAKGGTYRGHRSDELMAERFEADKISSPSP